MRGNESGLAVKPFLVLGRIALPASVRKTEKEYGVTQSNIPTHDFLETAIKAAILLVIVQYSLIFEDCPQCAAPHQDFQGSLFVR